MSYNVPKLSVINVKRIKEKEKKNIYFRKLLKDNYRGDI